MKRKFNEMIHSSFQQKIFYSLLLILLLCILPLLVMGFYSHPVGDDYTYGFQAHLAWESTGSLPAVIKAAAATAQSFWHSYQGPFASAFFMALQPAVISERLYALSPFIMLFMLIFSTSLFLRILLVKYFRLPAVSVNIITCVQLLFSIELLEAPSEAFFWYCGAIHYVFMQSCLFLLISVLLLAARTAKRTWLYILLSLPLALCCGGANFVTALTSVILFACALLFLLLIRKKRELLIILPSFIVNTAAFILNVTAPGNRVREAEQLASLPPVQAVYHAFRYCIEYLGKWTNLYVLLGIIFLIPLIWTAVSKLKIRLRLPGLFTLFSFCLLSSMFAPSTYALGLVVIYGRSLNIIMQAYYLLLILNLLYWIGWFRQNLPLSDEDMFLVPLRKHAKSLLLSLCAFLIFAAFCSDKTALTTKSAVHDLSRGYAQAYHQETLHRIALLSMVGVEEVWVPNYSVRPALLNLEDISTDPSNWRNQALADWYGKETVHLSIIY